MKSSVRVDTSALGQFTKFIEDNGLNFILILQDAMRFLRACKAPNAKEYVMWKDGDEFDLFDLLADYEASLKHSELQELDISQMAQGEYALSEQSLADCPDLRTIDEFIESSISMFNVVANHYKEGYDTFYRIQGGMLNRASVFK